MNPELLNGNRASLKLLRDFLLERVERSRELADCELRTILAQAPLPDTPSGEPTEKDVEDHLRATRILMGAAARVMLDCVCGTVNPPCPECRDPGVLLATVEVEDCEVIRICNLERTFVLTPLARRHWNPLIGLVGRGMELLCCLLPRVVTNLFAPLPTERRENGATEPTDDDRPEPSAGARTGAPGEGVFGRMRATIERAQDTMESTLRGTAHAGARTYRMARAAGSLGALLGRSVLLRRRPRISLARFERSEAAAALSGLAAALGPELSHLRVGPQLRSGVQEAVGLARREHDDVVQRAVDERMRAIFGTADTGEIARRLEHIEAATKKASEPPPEEKGAEPEKEGDTKGKGGSKGKGGRKKKDDTNDEGGSKGRKRKS